MNDHNTEQQLRYLGEVCTCLYRAGFETTQIEDSQIPVEWNDAPLCRITGKGSVFYRREDVNIPQAGDALLCIEGIAARTMEYMTVMETAQQLKASGLEGDYRILADFNGTVLAGVQSGHGVHFVTWDWDYGHTGVCHGHYFIEDYAGAKQGFAVRSGLITMQSRFWTVSGRNCPTGIPPVFATKS